MLEVPGLRYHVEIKDQQDNLLVSQIQLTSLIVPPPEQGSITTVGGRTVTWNYRHPNNIKMKFWADEAIIRFLYSLMQDLHNVQMVNLHVKLGAEENPLSYNVFKRCFIRSSNYGSLDYMEMDSEYVPAEIDWRYEDRETVLTTPEEMIVNNELWASISLGPEPVVLTRETQWTPNGPVRPTPIRRPRPNGWRFPVTYEEEPQNSLTSVNWRRLGF